METENIQKFLMPPEEGGAYTDEKLAALLAHAQDGKLGFASCCCFIGIPGANHRLLTPAEYQSSKDCYGDHMLAARKLAYGAGAEKEFENLGNGVYDDKVRRERLIPLILAEMERRERKANLSASAGCYGSEEPTADDGEEGYLDEEPYWSDSLTAQQLQESRGKAK